MTVVPVDMADPEDQADLDLVKSLLREQPVSLVGEGVGHEEDPVVVLELGATLGYLRYRTKCFLSYSLSSPPCLSLEWPDSTPQ